VGPSSSESRPFRLSPASSRRVVPNQVGLLPDATHRFCPRLDGLHQLGPRRDVVRCPLCGSADTALTAAFSGTACKALRRCRSCGEPFEQVKEL
jgi:hypothetical protein